MGNSERKNFSSEIITWKCKLASLASSWRCQLYWQLQTISKIAPSPSPILKDDCSSKNSTLSKLPIKLTKAPNEMCETNDRGNLVLEAQRGCFLMETTLVFPPKPPRTFLNHVWWVYRGLEYELTGLGWKCLVWPEINRFCPKPSG